MKIFLKLTMFIFLFFISCNDDKFLDYNRIEVYDARDSKIIFVITDNLVIESFEKQLISLKKKDYLKNPSNYKYFVKCHSKNTVDIYFINEKYIGKKDGVYPSNVNFLKLLNIEK